MAFQDQVEDLTSISVSDTAELTQFLTDGVIDVTNRCLAARPQDALDFAAVSAEQTGNGFDLNGAQVISVVREANTNDDWRDCRKIPPGMQSRVADANSIHYASIYNPAYMEFENGKISVFPDPGSNPNAFKVYYVNNVPVDSGGTALAYDDTTIKNFPSQKIYLVIMYAGMRLLQATMGNNIISVSTVVPVAVPAPNFGSDLSISSTIPTTPSINTIMYVDAENSDASSTLIGAITVATVAKADITGNAPAYTKPSLALKPAPTISDLTITAVPPDVPTISAQSVSLTGTAPTYTSPTTTISGESWGTAYPSQISSINTLISSMDNAIAQAKNEADEIQTQTDNSGDIETALDAMNTELDKVDDIIDDANTEFDKCDALLSKGEIDSEADVNTALAAINTAVDNMSAEITLAKTEIVGIENAVNQFRADGGDPALFGDESTYLTGSSVMQRWQVQFDDARNALDGAIPATAYNVANNLADVDAALNDEDIELASGRMQQAQSTLAYSQQRLALAKGTLEEWNATTQTLSAEIQGFMTGAQGSIANASAYNQQATSYMQEVNARLAQASAKREECQARIGSGNAFIQEAQARIAQASGYAQEVSARGGFTAAKSQAIQGFIAVANGYANEINNRVSALVTPKVSEYQVKVQDALNTFNDANVEYQANIQKDIQNAQLADSNEAKKLQKYSAELQEYQAEVNTEIQEYQQNMAGDLQVWQQERQTDLAKYSSDIQNEVNEFNKENAIYQANIQAEIAKHNTDLQKALTQAQLDAADAQQEAQQATTIDQFNKSQDQVLSLSNKAKQMEKLIADNNSIIQKFQAELTKYQNEVNTEVQDFSNTLNKEVQEYQNKITKYNAELQAYQAESAKEQQEQSTKIQQYQLLYNQLKAEYDQAFAMMYPRQQQQAAAGTA